MEIFKRHKCIEYGIDNEGMLFLCENDAGFTMDDTPENRKYMEKEFNIWKESVSIIGCKGCQYMSECRF